MPSHPAVLCGGAAGPAFVTLFLQPALSSTPGPALRPQSFPGHKDAVTGLAFREGTHQLFSASLDRSVKIWSLDDMAYVDTLFGHQAEVGGGCCLGARFSWVGRSKLANRLRWVLGGAGGRWVGLATSLSAGYVTLNPIPVPLAPSKQVLGIDALRAERVVTCAGDRTCRVWKVAEESQLIFR